MSVVGCLAAVHRRQCTMSGYLDLKEVFSIARLGLRIWAKLCRRWCTRAQATWMWWSFSASGFRA